MLAELAASGAEQGGTPLIGRSLGETRGFAVSAAPPSEIKTVKIVRCGTERYWKHD